MKFEHADTFAAETILDADVCVIGSGAAGITVATQLDGSGLSVLLLEAGGLEQNARSEQDSFAIAHSGVPYGNPIATRGRWYGGSTNQWFGRIAMPDPIDLAERTWVPYSGWPLTHATLMPWMKKAGRILEVPHFEKLAIENWPDNPTIDTFVRTGGARLGVFLWAHGLYMGPRWQSRLASSQNVRVLLHATATEIVLTPYSNSVERLDILSANGKRLHARARSYVLAAGGLENPRLLLASQARSRHGVGNGRDLVGRFYMDHPRGEGTATLDLRRMSDEQIERLRLLGEKSRSAYGKVQLRLTFQEQLQRDEQLLNHSLHVHLVSDVHESESLHSARRLRDHAKARSVNDLRSLARDVASVVRASPELARYGLEKLFDRTRPSKLVVIDQMEQEPDPDSRVTLDESHRDRFGLPNLRLDWRIGESTYRSQRRMHQLFSEILAKVGIDGLRSDVLERANERVRLVEMKHPTGTTRMSDSADRGVVDRDGRVHGVNNLYVTGSSVFPTGGHFNPTLLIVALAARLSDKLKAQLRSSMNFALLINFAFVP